MTLPTVTQGVCQVAANRGACPLNISYELYGTGTQRAIFVMGLGAIGKSWLPQAQFLPQHDFQVCIFDNRGVGSSDVPDEPFTIGDMVMDTIELLDHLGWTSDVHLIGASMGGLISQGLASEYPQYFKSVCLTSTFRTIEDPDNLDIKERLKYAAQLDPVTRFKQGQELIYPVQWLDSSSRMDPTKNNRELLLEMVLSIDPNDYAKINKGYERQVDAITIPYMTEEKLIKIRDSNLKVLICTGDIDYLVAPSNSEDLANILQAPLKVFRGCGHCIHAEKPDEYNEAILEFIRSSSS
ncbi:Alpha/Beta hydrolase protein [Syncephalis fuscata]|nr:Alpha/Beta hydrolase protein [Syncephalis fuscata]